MWNAPKQIDLNGLGGLCMLNLNQPLIRVLHTIDWPVQVKSKFCQFQSEYIVFLYLSKKEHLSIQSQPNPTKIKNKNKTNQSYERFANYRHLKFLELIFFHDEILIVQKSHDSNILRETSKWLHYIWLGTRVCVWESAEFELRILHVGLKKKKKQLKEHHNGFLPLSFSRIQRKIGNSTTFEFVGDFQIRRLVTFNGLYFLMQCDHWSTNSPFSLTLKSGIQCVEAIYRRSGSLLYVNFFFF